MRRSSKIRTLVCISVIPSEDRKRERTRDPPLTRTCLSFVYIRGYTSDFERPEGNNPLFRSLDHVEEPALYFPEYYGFLYSSARMYPSRVCVSRAPCIPWYVSIRLCTCKSGSPIMQRRRREWKSSYGSSASACKCLVVSEIAATKSTKLY